jgi:glycine cleavage system H lipoate-binding protein
MTRQVDSKNQIWFEKQDQVTNIGFTRDFINSLDQCWHILPANMERFREKAPLLTVETNDALVSILSPVTGTFLEFTNKAQDFPNKLTEADVVIKVADRNVVPQRPAAGLGRVPDEMRIHVERGHADWLAQQLVQPRVEAHFDARVQQQRNELNRRNEVRPQVQPRQFNDDVEEF